MCIQRQLSFCGRPIIIDGIEPSNFYKFNFLLGKQHLLIVVSSIYDVHCVSFSIYLYLLIAEQILGSVEIIEE